MLKIAELSFPAIRVSSPAADLVEQAVEFMLIIMRNHGYLFARIDRRHAGTRNGGGNGNPHCWYSIWCPQEFLGV